MLQRAPVVPSGTFRIHPYWLGRGLVSAWAMGSTHVIDLANRNRQTVAYNGVQAINNAGRGLLLGGAGGCGIPNASLSAGQTVTRIAVLSFGATNPGGTISADAHGSGSGRLQWRAGPTYLSVVKSGVVEMANWTIDAPAGRPAALAFAYDNGALRGYHDGKLVGSSTSAQTFGAYLVAALGQNYNGENFTGIINLHLDFNQSLTDQELRFITADPRRILVPQRPPILVMDPPAVTPGTSRALQAWPRTFLAT